MGSPREKKESANEERQERASSIFSMQNEEDTNVSEDELRRGGLKDENIPRRTYEIRTRNLCYTTVEKKAIGLNLYRRSYGEKSIHYILKNVQRLLPAWVSREEREGRIKRVVEELGLEHVANSRIGDERRRGISGGERRRVSIGVDVIHDPPLLLLDEPTTGLDSCAALHVVEMLHSMAEARRRTVVLSIHQAKPSNPLSRCFNPLPGQWNGHSPWLSPLSTTRPLMRSRTLWISKHNKMATSGTSMDFSTSDGDGSDDVKVYYAPPLWAALESAGDERIAFANSRMAEIYILCCRFTKIIYRRAFRHKSTPGDCGSCRAGNHIFGGGLRPAGRPRSAGFLCIYSNISAGLHHGSSAYIRPRAADFHAGDLERGVQSVFVCALQYNRIPSLPADNGTAVRDTCVLAGGTEQHTQRLPLLLVGGVVDRHRGLLLHCLSELIGAKFHSMRPSTRNLMRVVGRIVPRPSHPSSLPDPSPTRAALMPHRGIRAASQWRMGRAPFSLHPGHFKRRRGHFKRRHEAVATSDSTWPNANAEETKTTTCLLVCILLHSFALQMSKRNAVAWSPLAIVCKVCENYSKADIYNYRIVVLGMVSVLKCASNKSLEEIVELLKLELACSIETPQNRSTMKAVNVLERKNRA
eukprot:Gb_11918 [translate_table: standard]